MAIDFLLKIALEVEAGYCQYFLLPTAGHYQEMVLSQEHISVV
jgi:hypothetical protein